jgi:hypothetical protein
MRDERNGNRIVFYFRMRVERNEKCRVVFDESNTIIPVSPQSLGKRREHDEKRNANGTVVLVLILIMLNVLILNRNCCVCRGQATGSSQEERGERKFRSIDTANITNQPLS